MEKSIETIWKEGFLKNDALVIPKLNNLYKQKSKHILDKIKRMIKINLVAIVVGSTVFLIISFFIGIPVVGIGFFLICNVIVLINRRLMQSLNKIDKNVNSYQYLKDFDGWLKEHLSLNRRMAYWYYPLFFLTTVLGIWFSYFGQAAFHSVLSRPNSIFLVNGIPVFWLLTVIIVACILGFLGGRIYNWDVHLVYGRVFKKLNELINDMEELRS